MSVSQTDNEHKTTKVVDPAKIRVAVLAGGVSNERPVSLVSGGEVYKALVGAGYTCKLVDPQDVPTLVETLTCGCFDVAFLALHGAGGEDGTIQGFCEILGMPYTGSGVGASALAMDKARSKVMFQKAGIPVADSVLLRNGEPYDIDAIIAAVGQKSVVKPVRDGSSVAMSIVHDVADLPEALQKAFATGEDVMVESFVRGTEITIAVLGNEDPEALPIIEIVPHAEFYNYEVKYAVNGAEHIIPARLDPEVYERASNYAVAAHKALGCRGMSRSDFIVREDGTCVILETNTIPGMTPTSLLPDAARHAGYGFVDLCRKIIELALA